MSFTFLVLMMIDNLSILGWNCRGSTGKDKVNRLRGLMKESRLDIIALVETWADDTGISSFCDKFAKFWN